MQHYSEGANIIGLDVAKFDALSLLGVDGRISADPIVAARVSERYFDRCPKNPDGSANQWNAPAQHPIYLEVLRELTAKERTALLVRIKSRPLPDGVAW
jgi:hypothetical protein